jgi:hypothetical protein
MIACSARKKIQIAQKISLASPASLMEQIQSGLQLMIY